MTLQDLVQKISTEMKISQNQARDTIHKVCEGITEGLVKEGTVRLGALGSFDVKVRKARVSRNPRTGGKLFVPQKNAVTFRPSKELKEHVGKRGGASAPDAGVETQQDLDSARDAASNFLLDAMNKNADVGKGLHSTRYTAAAGTGAPAQFPEEKEKVAEAIRNDLGGDFVGCTITPQFWEMTPNGVGFKFDLEVPAGQRAVDLKMAREKGEWKVESITRK